MWPDAYGRFGEQLVEDAIVYATAQVQEQREHPELVVGRLVPVADGPAALARGLALRLSAQGEPDLLDRLALALARYRGADGSNRVPVYLVIADDNGRTAELRAADEWSVSPPAVDLAELEALVGATGGETNARFVGSRRPAAG